MRRFGAECATFSFETSKENAAPGKRKMFCVAKPAAPWGLPFCLVTGVFRIGADTDAGKSSAGCAMLRRLNNCVPAGRTAVQDSGGRCSLAAPLAALSAALSAAGAKFCVYLLPPGGESKGEGPQPLPFWPLGGVGAKLERPHVSGGGLGEVSFCKRHLPRVNVPRLLRRGIRHIPSGKAAGSSVRQEPYFVSDSPSR